jgi:hypothetical protein
MNNLTTVEMIEQGSWRVISRSEDDLFSAEVVLDVKSPALDIRQAKVEVKRDVLGLVQDLSTATDKLIGVRVGPGMTKIVRAVLGGENGSNRLAELVLDSMEMLVNAITVPELKKANELGGVSFRSESDGPKVYLNDRVIGEEIVRLMAGNPRMKDSCAAFRDL